MDAATDIDALLVERKATAATLPSSVRTALDDDGFAVLPALLDGHQVELVRGELAAIVDRAQADPVRRVGGSVHL